jgi:hypothetical protein
VKPKGIAIFAAIGISLAVIIFFVVRSQQPREPNYQGRSLSSWLEDFSDDSDEGFNTNSPASVAVRSMGTNTIPFLLEILSYAESTARKKLRKLAEKSPIPLTFFEKITCLRSKLLTR